jgi:hypothetical protein
MTCRGQAAGGDLLEKIAGEKDYGGNLFSRGRRSGT